MDRVMIMERIRELFDKYKYAVLILLVGLMFMLIPQESSETEENILIQTEVVTLEEKLEEILCQIQGAGRVEVLLTEQTGQEIRFQTDEDTRTDPDSSSQQTNTVLIDEEGNGENGLITRVDSPVYRGAVVVCQGADHPQVRLAIVEAVCCVTGLGADQISVVKMK